METPGSFSGGEFGDGDGIDVHGIGVFLWSGGKRGGLRSSPSKCLYPHLLSMEHLGPINPIFDCYGDERHGENHGGNPLVQSEGELVDEGDVVGDSCFTGEVLEVSDVLLEAVVKGSIEAFGGFLNQFGSVKAGCGFGIKGVEGGFKVLCELLEGFLSIGDVGIRELIIPHFGKIGSSSFTHFV